MMLKQPENKMHNSELAFQSVAEAQRSIQSLRLRLNSALVGKSDVIEMVIACVLARGHLLFDDLPGLGKTTLAKALAASIGGDFARVQCTPDLLPTDISGFNVFNQKTQEFEFRRGPVFSDLLLADEINRATPRTQSALFEAMAERQVTIDNNTMPLASTFLVIATQNPIESHGAYPLPEAQLDRFAIKLSIGYPARTDEIAMLADNIGSSPAVDEQHAVTSLYELSQLQDAVQNVEVTELIRGYFVDLAIETRQHADIEIGLSPRGVIIWQRMAQAWPICKTENSSSPMISRPSQNQFCNCELRASLATTIRPLMKSLILSTFRKFKMKFKKIATVYLIAVCALLVGCNAEIQKANSNQESWMQEGADSHPHPNLSLHKPKTFSSAIQRLKQMHESLIGDGDFPPPVAIPYVEVIHGQGAAGHSHFYSAAEYEATEGGTGHDGYPGEHSEEDERVKHHSMEVDLRTELTDVAAWLPKIAAKSNLNETDWNSVDSISGRLSKIIVAIASNASDASFRESWKLKSEEVGTMLAELQTFDDSSGATE